MVSRLLLVLKRLLVMRCRRQVGRGPLTARFVEPNDAIRSLLTMSVRHSLVRSVFSNWGNMALTLVLSFILAPIVVRGLGDTWYGVWAVAMQFTAYLWLLDLGIRESVVRYVARSRARRDQETVNAKISLALYLYVLVAAATLVIGAVVATWGVGLLKIDATLAETARLVVMLSAVNMAVGWLVNPLSGALIGLQRFDLMNVTAASVSIVRFAGTIVLVRSGYGIVGLSVLQIGATCLSGAGSLAICRWLMPDLRAVGPRRAFRELREVWSFSSYIVVNNLASKVIFASDSFVIGSHLPVAAVTYYLIPLTLVQHLANTIRSMSQVFYPLTSAFDGTDDRERLRQLFLRGSTYAALVAFPIGAVYLTIGPDFIRIWMGDTYAERSAAVLLILTVAHMMAAPHHAVYYVLLGVGRQRGVALLRVAEAAANLTLSLILVRQLGIVGVAIGTTVPHVVAMVIMMPMISARHVGVTYAQYLATVVMRPVISVAPALGLGYLLHVRWPATTFAVFATQVAAVVFLFAAVAWRICCTAAERDFVVERLKRFRNQPVAAV